MMTMMDPGLTRVTICSVDSSLSKLIATTHFIQVRFQRPIPQFSGSAHTASAVRKALRCLGVWMNIEWAHGTELGNTLEVGGSICDEIVLHRFTPFAP